MSEREREREREREYLRAVQRPGQPDPPPTDPTSPAVGDGFVSPKPEFGRSEVGFPSLESNQIDPTDPQDFWRYLVDPVRFRPFSSRSRRDFAGSNQDLVENGLD